jgi:hypothetical protein
LPGFSFFLPYIELNKQTVIALDLAGSVEERANQLKDSKG